MSTDSPSDHRYDAASDAVPSQSTAARDFGSGSDSETSPERLHDHQTVSSVERDSIDSPQLSEGSTQESEEIPVFPGYRVIRKIGEHGQGQVYLAEDMKLHHQVAIKRPKARPHLSWEVFEQEARSLAKVKHPSVVPIHTLASHDHWPYFVMDYVEGEHLGNVILRCREAHAQKLERKQLIDLLHLDPSRIDEEVNRALSGRQPYYELVTLWIAQAAEALEAAHQRDLFHRDVKPANLLLARDGRIVVIDFGLARAMQVNPATVSMHFTDRDGTLPYIAPERVVGRGVMADHRADIWALGATLYELLVYQRAYPRQTASVLQDIVTKDPHPLDRHSAKPPAHLRQICEKAMERDPEQRYETCREMAYALRQGGGVVNMINTKVLMPVGIVAVAALAAVAMFAMPPSDRGSSVATESTSTAIDDAQVTQQVTEDAVKVEPASAAIEQAEPKPTTPTDAAANDADSKAPEADSAPVVEKPAALAPPVATIPSEPLLLIAFNQDLNVRDEIPVEAGGEAEGYFFSKLSEILEREGLDDRVTIAAAPEDGAWDEASRVKAARNVGATLIASGRLTARMLSPVENIEFGDSRVYRWRLTLEVELQSLRDGRRFRLKPQTLTMSAPAIRREGVDWRFKSKSGENQYEEKGSVDIERYEEPGEFSGNVDKFSRLSYDAAREAVTKLRKSQPAFFE